MLANDSGSGSGPQEVDPDEVGPSGRTRRQEIWQLLLLGQRSMLVRLAAELKRDFGLTVPDFEALRALREAPGLTLTASQLAARLVYTSGSASHLIARIARAGLVERESGLDDRRVAYVRLSAAGLDLIDRASAAHRASLTREFDPLIGDGDIAALHDFARALARNEGVLPALDVDGDDRLAAIDQQAADAGRAQN